MSVENRNFYRPSARLPRPDERIFELRRRSRDQYLARHLVQVLNKFHHYLLIEEVEHQKELKKSPNEESLSLKKESQGTFNQD